MPSVLACAQGLALSVTLGSGMCICIAVFAVIILMKPMEVRPPQCYCAFEYTHVLVHSRRQLYFSHYTATTPVSALSLRLNCQPSDLM
eukprot:scaffold582056_cov28-Prasinocladus_malaysianus.AAC.1